MSFLIKTRGLLSSFPLTESLACFKPKTFLNACWSQWQSNQKCLMSNVTLVSSKTSCFSAGSVFGTHGWMLRSNTDKSSNFLCRRNGSFYSFGIERNLPTCNVSTSSLTTLLTTANGPWTISTRAFDRYSNRALYHDHLKGPHKKFRPPRKPLDGKPMLRGVILKTLIKKPKKPNSANRKCVLVRLTNGKEAVAYIPGIGHNLQEHNVVLVRVGRLQDVPGVKLKCIRGKYDLPHVIKPQKV